jgi:hypothetical protein
MLRPCLIALGALASLLPAPAVMGQQFLSRQLPGPIEWSESAAAFDADEDGDLDLLIVHANGWSQPGDLQPDDLPLPPTLLRNDGTDIDGYPIWADASASFLPPALVLHGKGIVVFDADDDGHQDIAIAAGFQGQQVLLRKDPTLGIFVDETATRLPTLLLNSLSVAAGDIDDDGDLDLVFPDAGPITFAGPGGVARLLVNDGLGVFTDAPAQLGAVLKVGAQNAKFLDIDGDCDLDIIVDGKSPVTQLYLNDGSGQFSLDLTTVPDSNQGGYISTYETEFADMDGDSDFDAVIMNVGFEFVDAVAPNRLVETGVLRFGGALKDSMDANNCHDENDFAFLDADDDGDLDLLVATLPFTGGTHAAPSMAEKLYLNTGIVASGSLIWQAGAFNAGTDSTLDLAVADFDGNGTYDVVSVQGEYLPFRNLYHLNVGPCDTRAPVFLTTSTTATTLPLSELAGGWPRRAVIQDAVMDDGLTFVTADLVVSTDKGGETTLSTTAMKHVGSSVFRGVVDPSPSSTGLVGMDVSWHVEAADPMGNTSTSALQTTRLCGVESYGAPTPTAAISYSTSGEPTEGSVFTLQVSGGPANAGVILLVGLDRTALPAKGGVLLVDPNTLFLVNAQLDGSGSLALPVNIPDGLGWAGLGLTTQAAVFDGAQPQGISFSNGLELVICGS